MTIAYKFRRSGVKDGRERVPLFLQETTEENEREAKRELEKRFEEDVSKTDLREALMAVGIENIDDVEKQLEKWGKGWNLTNKNQWEAPDCRGCGRRMTAVAYGYSNPGNRQEASKRVDHAECACCPIEWSLHMGWQYIPREHGSDHIDFECIHKECPDCEAP